MKKGIILAAALLVIFGANAFAEKDAHYLEIQKYKQEQREAKKNAPASSATQEKGFWQKEGERSGLGNPGNNIGSFVKNLNPVPFFKSQQEQYQARKAAAGAK